MGLSTTGGIVVNSVAAILAFWLLQDWALPHMLPFGPSDLELLLLSCFGSAIFLRSTVINIGHEERIAAVRR